MSGGEACSCAVLTPPGAGAIAVIRVQGPQAASVVASLLRHKGWHPGKNEPALASLPHSAKLHYSRIVSGEESIDDVIVSWSPQREPPAIDICAHGGVRVVERILEALKRRGVTVSDRTRNPASPWQAANRIEDEALRMLATAKTGRAVRFLAAQRVQLTDHLDAIAADCLTNPDAAHPAIADLLDRYAAARRLLQGATVALVGPPNSGKSSLFNRLAGRHAATVSAQPGTTRDWVAADVEMGGVPITLADTAGRHDAVNPLERRGIAVGRQVGGDAEVRLLVLDGSIPLDASAATLRAELDSPSPLLVLANKSDLEHAWEPGDIHAIGQLAGSPVIRTSATTGAGAENVPTHVLKALGLDDFRDSSPCLFSGRQACIAADVLSSLPASGGLASAGIRKGLIGP